MFRVLVLVPILPLLAACSLGSQNLAMGFGSFGGSEPDSGSEATAFVNDIGPEPSRSGQPQVAAFDPGASRSSAKPSPRSDDQADVGKAELNLESARKSINAYRRQKGLGPLEISAELTNAAKSHSRDLAKWDRISHYGSDGSTPWDRVKQAGFRAQLAAENVGTGQATFDEVLTGWKNSDGHNKNLLLPDATHMGLALVNRPSTEFKTFWTLVIGRPM